MDSSSPTDQQEPTIIIQDVHGDEVRAEHQPHDHDAEVAHAWEHFRENLFFFGGLFLASPVTGPVVVLGFLATMIIAGIENAVVVGGVAALAAALYSIGVPKDSVLQYESAIKADSFLVMARGSSEEIARAKTILGATNPSRLDIHRDADAIAPVASSVPAAA